MKTQWKKECRKGRDKNCLNRYVETQEIPQRK